jgi:hypothetical protein
LAEYSRLQPEYRGYVGQTFGRAERYCLALKEAKVDVIQMNALYLHIWTTFVAEAIDRTYISRITVEHFLHKFVHIRFHFTVGSLSRAQLSAILDASVLRYFWVIIIS